MENSSPDEMVVIEEDAEEQTEEETEGNTEEESEDVISIEGETPPEQEEEQHAPEWVRDLRKKFRTTSEENKKLKAELESKNAPVATQDISREPTLEDFDYDTDEYKVALEKWFIKKNEHEKVKGKQQEEARQVLEKYVTAKQSLKVKDYDIVEDVVVEKLPIQMQNVILSVAENPALMVYAIGKNKAKLDELSKITDPLLFAKELGKLEGKLKVERKKMAPEPEKKISGSAGASGGADSKLEKLRAEAQKSGDMSKVMAYKRAMKK